MHSRQSFRKPGFTMYSFRMEAAVSTAVKPKSIEDIMAQARRKSRAVDQICVGGATAASAQVLQRHGGGEKEDTEGMLEQVHVGSLEVGRASIS